MRKFQLQLFTNSTTYAILSLVRKTNPREKRHMTPRRKNKLMFRWSIFSAILIALFWIIWSVFGEVPSVDKIKWTDNILEPDSYIHLPLSISRWFDILVGLLYSVLIVNLVYWAKSKKNKGQRYNNLFITGLITGLMVSLIFIGSLSTSLEYNLVLWFITSIFLTSMLNLMINYRYGIIFGFGFTLGYAFTYSLIFGFATWLAIVIIVGYVVYDVLVRTVKSVISGLSFLKNWLTVKE